VYPPGLRDLPVTTFNSRLRDYFDEASEVAYLIGFTEPPAFFKAFKRWTGMTPREFQHGAVAG
jgi:AraC-like DNA-binding protein